MKPPSDPQSFFGSFGSEPQLHAALLGLLDRMESVNSRFLTHGRMERGVDILVEVKGPYGAGAREWHGWVVKNSKVSGKVDSPAGAKGICHQLEQALENEHHLQDGTVVRISRAVLACPQPLTKEALYSIEGHLRRMSGSIQVIAGADLYGLFRQYYPQFFLRGGGAIEESLKLAKSRQSSLDAMAGLQFLSDMGLPTKEMVEVFVVPLARLDLSLIAISKTVRNFIYRDVLAHGEFHGQSAAQLLEPRLALLREFREHARRWGCLPRSHSSIQGFDQLSDSVRASIEAEAAVALLHEALRRKNRPEGRRAQDELTPEETQEEREYQQAKAKLLRAEKDCEDRKEALENDLRGCEGDIAILDRALSRLLSSQYLAKLGGGLDEVAPLTSVSISRALELAASEQKRYSFLRSCPGELFSVSAGPPLNVEPESLVDLDLSYCLSGPAGLGKTSFLRWYASRLAEAHDSGTSALVPVFVSLHSASMSTMSSVETLVSHGAVSTLSGELNTVEGGGIALLLDGLDELGNEELRGRAIQVAQEAAGRENWRVVLSTRDYVYHQSLSRFPRFELRGFDQERIKSYIFECFAGDRASRDKLWDEVRGNADLLQVMQTPLLAGIVILVFERWGRVESRRVELYRLFVDIMTGSWDFVKKVSRKADYGQKVKRDVAIEIALSVHSSMRRGFTEAFAVNCIQRSYPALRGSGEGILAEMVIDGLIHRHSFEFRFRHFSLQEYLAARGLQKRVNPAIASEAARSLGEGKTWWLETLKFFADIMDPVSFENWLDTYTPGMGGAGSNITVLKRYHRSRQLSLGHGEPSA